MLGCTGATNGQFSCRSARAVNYCRLDGHWTCYVIGESAEDVRAVKALPGLQFAKMCAVSSIWSDLCDIYVVFGPVIIPSIRTYPERRMQHFVKKVMLCSETKKHWTASLLRNSGTFALRAKIISDHISTKSCDTPNMFMSLIAIPSRLPRFKPSICVFAISTYQIGAEQSGTPYRAVRSPM